MNTTVTISELQNTLQAIISNEPNSIKAQVAQEALDYGCDQDIAHFFQDLCSHGCSSGMVGSLIYYHDTRAFYDEHYHEIEALREDYEDNTGLPITIKGDLKNFLSWFSFEETGFMLGTELGLL